MILSSGNLHHLPSPQLLSSSNASISSSSSSTSSSSVSSTPVSLHSYTTPTKFKHSYKARSPRHSTKRKRQDVHPFTLSPLPFPSSSPTSSSTTMSPLALSKLTSTSPLTSTSTSTSTTSSSSTSGSSSSSSGGSSVACSMPFMVLPPGHMDIDPEEKEGGMSRGPSFATRCPPVECTCTQTSYVSAGPGRHGLTPLIVSTKWKYELQLTFHLYAVGLLEEAVARHIEFMLHQSRGVHHNLKVAFEWYESQLIQSHLQMRELAHRLRVFASYNIYFCKLMGWQCLWLEVSCACQGNQVTKNFRYNSRARLPRYPPCPLHF
ncbi:hypothetical protein HMI55_006730 [Coelomomyces lativittatus]|nr:hypothetical protein HMI56_003565 [Coelomomyces lativittatus]KAJ1511078.1 hypothetical protein HMI55_006730 [Coelomomyces lativittatus]